MAFVCQLGGLLGLHKKRLTYLKENWWMGGVCASRRRPLKCGAAPLPGIIFMILLGLGGIMCSSCVRKRTQ